MLRTLPADSHPARPEPLLSHFRRPWTGWLQVLAAVFMILSPLPSSLGSWSDTDSDGHNDTWTDPNTSQSTTLADLNNQSTDADNDGATNDEEAAEGSNPFSYDTDLDGISDGDELHIVKPSIGVSLTNWDSDGDWVSDYDEWYGFYSVTYTDGQLPSFPGASYSDYDGDGFKNPIDPFPTDPTNYSEINQTSWYGDALGDADGDYTPNWQDAYPSDPYNDPSPDSDGDGIQDSSDPYPNDSNNYSATNSIHWYGDVLGDADSDGTPNWNDSEPYGPSGPTDSDGDGIDDSSDPYPSDATNYSSTNGITWNGDVLGDADSDGTPNWNDSEPYGPAGPTDSDGDGFDDSSDPYPNDPTNYSSTNGITWNADVLGDADSDGTPNWQDSDPYGVVDSDADGFPDSTDPFPSDNTNFSSINGMAWMNVLFDDADNDGMVNWQDPWPYDPYNGETPPDPDNDGDGLSASFESTYGTSDADVDTDDDGLTDYEELIVYSTNALNTYHLSQTLGWGNLYTDYQLVDTTDTDFDTIPDRIEIFYGMLPNNPEDGSGDLDGNGMTNAVQYSAGLALNVDLNFYDVDGDGMTDIFEDYYGLNKNSFADAMADADNDGVLNFEEAAILTSPQHPNSRNLEGLTDHYLLAVAMLYSENTPEWADANNNNLPDWYDDALVGTSPRFTWVAPGDLDGDGMPDVWEHQFGRWKYPTMGLYVRHDDSASDPDSDSLTNVQEYLLGSHPLIADSNGDGTSDGDADNDGDGISNVDEIALGTDPLKADTDGDGLTDFVEVQQSLDPRRADTDGDGMGDGWEQTHGFNANGADGQFDYDGDGLSNLEEYLNNLDPYTANEFGLKIFMRSRYGRAIPNGFYGFNPDNDPHQPFTWYGARRKLIQYDRSYNTTSGNTTTAYSTSRQFIENTTVEHSILTSAVFRELDVEEAWKATLEASATFTEDFHQHTSSGSGSSTDWTRSLDGTASIEGVTFLFGIESSPQLQIVVTGTEELPSGSTNALSYTYGGETMSPQLPGSTTTYTPSIRQTQGSYSGGGETSAYLSQLEYSGVHTLDDLIVAALGDLQNAPWSDWLSLPVGPSGFAPAADYVLGGPTVDGYDYEACPTVVEYYFKFVTPGDQELEGLAPRHISWQVAYNNAAGVVTTVSHEATVAPGDSSDTFVLDPMAKDSSQSGTERILYQAFVTSGGAGFVGIKSIGPTNLEPGVEVSLDPETPVQVSGGVATVNLVGTISDCLASAVPKDKGADIPYVNIYVDGELVAEEVPVERAPGPPDNAPTGIWPALHPYVGVIQTTAVSFTPKDQVVIRVETAPNAAGIKGASELILKFDPLETPGEQVSAHTVELTIKPPASFDESEIDEVLVALPGGSDQVAAETGDNSQIFVTESGISVEVLGDYAATAQVDTLKCAVTLPNGVSLAMPGMAPMDCEETGATTGIFEYEQTLPGYTLPPSLAGWIFNEVTPGELGRDGVCHPITVLLSSASYTEVRPLGSQGPALQAIYPIGENGELAPAYANGALFTAFLVQESPPAESGGEESQPLPPPQPRAFELLYYDEDAGVLVRRPLGADTNTAITLSSTIEGGTSNSGLTLHAWDLEFLNLEGYTVAGTPKLSAEALVAYVSQPNHDGVVIADEDCVRLRVRGLSPGHTVNVQSLDIATDRFLLHLPGDELPSASLFRSAPLKAAGGGNTYVSADKIVVYQSSPGIDRLTDGQWEALKGAGYLAVHNSEPVASLGDALDALTPGGSYVQPDGGVLHHIFQHFRGSKNVALKQQAKGFWKNVGIVVDDFAVPISLADNTRYHKRRDGWDTQWKNFITANSDANGKLTLGPNRTIADIKREALEIMWGQVGGTTPPLPIHKVMRYNKVNGQFVGTVGEQLNALQQLDLFDIEDLRKKNPTAFKRVLTRWGKEIGEDLQKRFGKRIAKKLLTSVGGYVVGLITLAPAIASGDPYAWAADQSGLNRATIIDLTNIDWDEARWGLPEPTGLKNPVELENGELLFHGRSVRIFAYNNQTGRITKVYTGTVHDFWREGPPGHYKATYVVYEGESEIKNIFTSPHPFTMMKDHEYRSRLQVGDYLFGYW